MYIYVKIFYVLLIKIFLFLIIVLIYYFVYDENFTSRKFKKYYHVQSLNLFLEILKILLKLLAIYL